MRTPTAVLVVAAVYTAGLIRRDLHARRAQIIAVEEMHQRLCAEAALQFPGEYGSEQESTEEKGLGIHANRVVSLLWAKYTVGQLDKRALRAVAQTAMRTPPIREYWRLHGTNREQESQTRSARHFHTVLEEAYAAHAARTAP
ncbi:DUF6082 family protein [Streptomyces sp. NPDC004286]|uniref:DUF6082 family protein n=1 Tax=Streptomyces sp. NPDC004286 TaxID=3364696 RepID=UPI0036C8CAD5